MYLNKNMIEAFEEYCNVSGFLTATCFFLVLLYLVSDVKKARRLPPGPVGLPVVGYLPFLTNMQHLKLMELGSKYGQVFSIRLGSNLLVVLNKGRIIREAFSKPEFLGRPPDNRFSLVKNFESPFFSSGRAWIEQRRFSMRTLKDLGLGKSRMEGHIMEEILDFLEVIRKSNGMPLNFAAVLTPSMSNNICSLVFGRRYKYDDPRRIFLDKNLECVIQCSQPLAAFIFFPWLRRLPFSTKFFQADLMKKLIEDLRTFVGERIDEHEKTLNPDNPRDYIDGYLTEMKTRLQNNPQTTFSRTMLTGSVMNFFVAGSETVRTTLAWCMCTMAGFPDVQKKIHAEIDAVICKERVPAWKDHKEMPFTQSVLTEVQRWKTVIPTSLLRYTTEDTELAGYFIPKGTSILPNLWAAHHDPEEWELPDKFIPDRFLSKDGKSVIKSENYMPFSTGKRACPGDHLALIEIFLYFASILQKFTVEMPEGSFPDFEGQQGLAYQPKPHMLCFKRRF